MNSDWGIVILLTSIFLPGVAFILIFRDLIFRRPGEENARVICQRGSSKDRENYFIKCFRSFPKGTFAFIVAGEANPEFYTQGVAEAIHEVRSMGVITKMICGPTVICRVNDRLHSDILDLAEKGSLELYLSKKRQALHFRVATTGRLYYEQEHIPGYRGIRIGYNIPRNLFEAKPYLRRFKRLLLSGDIVRSTDPYSDFVLVTREEQDELFRKLTALGKDYNQCDINEIRRALQEIRAERVQ